VAAARRADIFAQAIVKEWIREKSGRMLSTSPEREDPYVIAIERVEQIHLGQECPKMSGFVRLEKDSGS
jgi:hypothetical protein